MSSHHPPIGGDGEDENDEDRGRNQTVLGVTDCGTVLNSDGLINGPPIVPNMPFKVPMSFFNTPLVIPIEFCGSFFESAMHHCLTTSDLSLSKRRIIYRFRHTTTNSCVIVPRVTPDLLEGEFAAGMDLLDINRS